MNIQDSLERFKQLLSIQFMAEGTKKNYEIYVTRFLAYCSWAEDTDQIQLEHIQNFILDLSNHLASSTVGIAVSAIRTYCECILERSYSKRQIPKPKIVQERPASFTSEEVRILSSQCHDLRLKAWIHLGFDCGLRVSEIAHLKWDNVDHKNRILYIENSKRDKTRAVPYSLMTKDVLNHYCKVFGMSPKTSASAYVFPAIKKQGIKKEDKSISPTTISSKFKAYAEKFPFYTEKHHFHSLRHSYASAMVEKTQNPYQVAELMGHSCIQTTMKYIHLSPDHFKNLSSPCDDWNTSEKKGSSNGGRI